MPSRLAGKVALVTGGARGLGAAVVELFAEEGADVVFGDVRDDLGHEVEQRLKGRGMPVTYISLDVTDAEQWRAAVDLANARYGSLTTLVNNAAVFGPGGVLDTSPESWSDVLRVNLDGQWLGMRAALPELLKAAGRGPAIVNVCSVFGNIGSPGTIAYSVSKGGVRMLTKSAALEYAEHGIRVNSLHPGFIDTPMIVADGVDEQAAQIVPLKRMGSPREIAYGALFLASDEAAYMTGAEVIIDGGWSVP